MHSRYDPLNDLAERQRREAEAERQRVAEAQRQAEALRFAELDRYRVLKELEEQQRREREQIAANQQRIALEQEQRDAEAKYNEQRKSIEETRQRAAQEQEWRDIKIKIELDQYKDRERDLAQRSLKIREDESHHPARMRADIDELWEREARSLEEERRQIIRNEPSNLEKMERHEQHQQQMQEAVYFPKEVLAQQQDRDDRATAPTLDETNRQQTYEREKLAASPVATLATETARMGEASPAPSSAPTKSAREIERDEILAAFDRTRARSLEQRDNEWEQDGGRELGR